MLSLLTFFDLFVVENLLDDPLAEIEIRLDAQHQHVAGGGLHLRALHG